MGKCPLGWLVSYSPEQIPPKETRPISAAPPFSHPKCATLADRLLCTLGISSLVVSPLSAKTWMQNDLAKVSSFTLSLRFANFAICRPKVSLLKPAHLHWSRREPLFSWSQESQKETQLPFCNQADTRKDTWAPKMSTHLQPMTGDGLQNCGSHFVLVSVTFMQHMPDAGT